MLVKTLLWTATLLLLAVFGTRAETSIERGSYLANSVLACGSCHMSDAPGAQPFTGGRRFVTIAYTAHAANLTPEKETGLGNWTDEQLVNGIRNGKRPRGSTIGWPMPIASFSALSDADVKAVVAFLRSLPEVINKTPRSTYRKPLPTSYGPEVTSVPLVPESDRLSYGRYLATIASCTYCHSRPGEDGTPDLKDGLAAGGREFRGPWGQSMAPALTPAAIGFYSDADLKAIIRTGMRPDGRKLLPPMPVAQFAGMKDGDVDAIVGWLRTLK